jgi:predicted Rossmann fold nucleotide-binding protein DprA/Smf involved in DNA uptake
VNGDISNIDEQLCIAVVGTRNPSPYDFLLRKNWKRAGFLRRGSDKRMARGIDTAAHTGALRGLVKPLPF